MAKQREDTIGVRLRTARRARGLSQSDLAARLGVSQPAVANWEAGAHDPRHLMLGKIAETLQVTRAWLADGVEKSPYGGREAMSAYLRRPLIHVPVITLESAANARLPGFDPRDHAQDFIPVTSPSTRLFAVFADDDAVNLAFPKDTIVVVDYGEASPVDGAFFLATPEERPTLRMWRDGPPRLEPYSSDPTHQSYYVEDAGLIIGRARLAIRIY